MGNDDLAFIGKASVKWLVIPVNIYDWVHQKGHNLVFCNHEIIAIKKIDWSWSLEHFTHCYHVKWFNCVCNVIEFWPILGPLHPFFIKVVPLDSPWKTMWGVLITQFFWISKLWPFWCAQSYIMPQTNASTPFCLSIWT